LGLSEREINRVRFLKGKEHNFKEVFINK
jgi:hypothetical protein